MSDDDTASRASLPLPPRRPEDAAKKKPVIPPVPGRNNNNKTNANNDINKSATTPVNQQQQQSSKSPAPTPKNSSSSGSAGPALFRNRLINFYKKYKPEKVNDVDVLLHDWKGREFELFKALESKYGPEPTATNTPNNNTKGLPEAPSTKRTFKEQQSRDEQRKAAAAAAAATAQASTTPRAQHPQQKSPRQFPPPPAPKMTSNKQSSSAKQTPRNIPVNPSNNNKRPSPISPRPTPTNNINNRTQYQQQNAASSSDYFPASSPPNHDPHFEEHMYDYQRWLCSKSPIIHYNIGRFPSPLRYYCYTSYYVSFWLTMLNCLLTTFSVPFVYWMMQNRFKVLLHGDDFTNFTNYRNFLWSFLSLFVAPFFFFFLWHYPFYLAVEEQTEDEDFLERQRDKRRAQYQEQRNISAKRKRAAKNQNENDDDDGNNNAAVIRNPGTPMTPRSANGGDDTSSSSINNGSPRENENENTTLLGGNNNTDSNKVEYYGGNNNNKNEDDDDAHSASRASFVSTAPSNASFAFLAQEVLVPLWKTWFSSFFAIAFFNFCVLQFAGANFLSASGVGFLVSMKKEFESNLEAAGSSVAIKEKEYWSIIALPLTATIIWGIMMLISLTWIIVIFRRKWKESGRKFGVAFMIILMIASLVLLLVWILIWQRQSFFPQPQPYARHFCFKNSCGELIRVMNTGADTGLSCSAGCPAGTVCNPSTNQCFFSFPKLSGRGLVLGSGGKQCIEFGYDAIDTVSTEKKSGKRVVMNLQYSGSIYASSGCSDGGQNCKTGLCDSCPPYRGPSGPVTQFEATMPANSQGPDFFDLTIINGINLPMKVTPIVNPNVGVFQTPSSGTSKEYYCTTVGDPKTCSWKFLDNFKPVGSYFPLVDPSVPNGGGPCPCSSPSLTCGTAMVLQGNLPTTQVQENVCGALRGFFSFDELCAWTAGAFSTCQSTPPGATGQLQTLFGCDATYSESCFQQHANANCCGCSTWGDLGLKPADGFTCQNSNPTWTQYVKPSLTPLKKGCPQCYVYPYDDATSTFTCRGNSTINDNSYEIEWCPNGVELG